MENTPHQPGFFGYFIFALLALLPFGIYLHLDQKTREATPDQMEVQAKAIRNSLDTMEKKIGELQSVISSELPTLKGDVNTLKTDQSVPRLDRNIASLKSEVEMLKANAGSKKSKSSGSFARNKPARKGE